MQAKAMRNYHLHHPFDDSPAALPWPSDPPETVRKLADLMRSEAGSDPRGHLCVTWGVYLCASRHWLISYSPIHMT